MSLSKTAANCGFCKIGKGIYSCPRCNKKYCSSHCYKSRAHVECSEDFYKEWVQQSLQEKSSDGPDKENMLRILQKFAEDAEDPTDEYLSIEDRFSGININNADEDAIWENLTEEERHTFKNLIEDKEQLGTIVTLKQPWWTNLTLNLVIDEDSDDSDWKSDTAPRPPYPLNSKKLSDLTSSKPSNCIQYNLVNILYSYAFLCRFYNCDLRDFLENVVESIFAISPVLSEGRNYYTLEESLQDSIRLISTLNFDVPFSFIKSIVDDVGNILNGPNNSKASVFVLCALHDIKLLFLELKHSSPEQGRVDKSLRKNLSLATKKVEYFMSWSVEYEGVFNDISSDLVLVMLPDLIHDPNHFAEDVTCISKEKPLIEEVE